jgi:hypothetical protein
MRRSQGWARARLPGAHIMRLGAWYQIVDEGNPSQIVIDIAGRKIPVDRDLVDVTGEAPQRFGVVYRSVDDRNPACGSPDDVGPTYAVCPASSTRVPLINQPDYLECPSCGGVHPVDWEAPSVPAAFGSW